MKRGGLKGSTHEQFIFEYFLGEASTLNPNLMLTVIKTVNISYSGDAYFEAGGRDWTSVQLSVASLRLQVALSMPRFPSAD